MIMIDEFINLDKIIFLDYGSVTTTTTSTSTLTSTTTTLIPTTTTTTTEAIPYIHSCQDCDPVLSSQYKVTFGNLDGGLSLYNGTYVVPKSSGTCQWHLELSDSGSGIWVGLWHTYFGDEVKPNLQIAIYDASTKGFMQWVKVLDDICDIIQTSTPDNIIDCKNTDSCNAFASISEV